MKLIDWDEPRAGLWHGDAIGVGSGDAGITLDEFDVWRIREGVPRFGIAFRTDLAPPAGRRIQHRQRLAEDAPGLLPLAGGEKRLPEVLEDERIARGEILGARQLRERRGNLPTPQETGPIRIRDRAVVGALLDGVGEERLRLLERFALLDQRVAHVVERARVVGRERQYLAHGAERGLLLSAAVLRAPEREEDAFAARLGAGGGGEDRNRLGKVPFALQRLDEPEAHRLVPGPLGEEGLHAPRSLGDLSYPRARQGGLGARIGHEGSRFTGEERRPTLRR